MKNIAGLCDSYRLLGLSTSINFSRDVYFTRNMNQFDTFLSNVESEEVYPVLIIPKQCTTLQINYDVSENVFINLNITAPDTDGNENEIYSGFCNVKLVDSEKFNINLDLSAQSVDSGTSFDSTDIDQMPVVLTEANQLSFPSYDQSQVWIDPSRSPYVYNSYDATTNERYSIHESGGIITVNQHNTYVTQNIFKYNEGNVYNNCRPSDKNGTSVGGYERRNLKNGIGNSVNRQGINSNVYEEDEFECGIVLSQLPQGIRNEELRAREQSKKQCNNALKQLLSTNSQTKAKERKTILFLGHDSNSGQTIQNISYNDPKIKCAELDVDNEVVIDDSLSKPKVKKYQCDKCKQIFNQLSAFRQHMVRNHSKSSTVTQHNNVTFTCLDCGKNLKTQKKFEKHCLGHGDPELECQKCFKVFASKFTLRAHNKIHDRKYPCSYCDKLFATSDLLDSHMKKAHNVFKCKYDDCSYMGSKIVLAQHYNDHLHIDRTDNFLNNNYFEDVTDEELDVDGMTVKEHDLKYEGSDDTKEEEKIRMADSVISKVISNGIFQLNSKMVKKNGRFQKSCDVCHKPFDRISDLKRHLIEHIVKSTLAKTPVNSLGLLSIVCEICQMESFDKVDKYKAHLREHAKLTIYKCTFCDKSFSDSSNFSKHKKTHGLAYLQCDLCQRKFNSKKMISQHMEYHNKNEPIKCGYCYKEFHFESTLKKHIKCVHGKVDSISFRCRFCSHIFKSLKDKWDHEWKVHKVRKVAVDCRVCGSKFRKYTELKRHCHERHNMGIPTVGLLKKWQE